MQDVTTVFFDAGGTLVHPHEDVGEVYARTGRTYGVDARPEQLMASFLQTFGEHKLDGRRQDKAWWRQVVDETFRPFGGGRDPRAMFEELYAHFCAPGSWRLFPDALQTILTLQARGYRTALISNWDDRLPELLTGLELEPLLDPIVISYRVGAEKPHARIFETALEEAGVQPSEALMVGDDYQADVDGARALGMGAVFVRRPGRSGGNGVLVIDDLIELLDHLPARSASP